MSVITMALRGSVYFHHGLGHFPLALQQYSIAFEDIVDTACGQDDRHKWVGQSGVSAQGERMPETMPNGSSGVP